MSCLQRFTVHFTHHQHVPSDTLESEFIGPKNPSHITFFKAPPQSLEFGLLRKVSRFFERQERKLDMWVSGHRLEQSHNLTLSESLQNTIKRNINDFQFPH